MQQIEKKISCKDCGVVLIMPEYDLHSKFNCPRCKAVVFKFGQNSIVLISFAISSLILLLPAMFLPLLKIKLFNIEHTATLMETLNAFMSNGYFFLSIFVVLIGLIFPVLVVVSILMMLYYQRDKKDFLKVLRLYKIYRFLKQWYMPEVYLLSLLVAAVKLQQSADLFIGAGLYFFIAFLIFMYSTIALFNSYELLKK